MNIKFYKVTALLFSSMIVFGSTPAFAKPLPVAPAPAPKPAAKPAPAPAAKPAPLPPVYVYSPPPVKQPTPTPPPQPQPNPPTPIYAAASPSPWMVQTPAGAKQTAAALDNIALTAGNLTAAKQSTLASGGTVDTTPIGSALFDTGKVASNADVKALAKDSIIAIKEALAAGTPLDNLMLNVAGGASNTGGSTAAGKALNDLTAAARAQAQVDAIIAAGASSKPPVYLTLDNFNITAKTANNSSLTSQATKVSLITLTPPAEIPTFKPLQDSPPSCLTNSFLCYTPPTCATDASLCNPQPTCATNPSMAGCNTVIVIPNCSTNPGMAGCSIAVASGSRAGAAASSNTGAAASSSAGAATGSSAGAATGSGSNSGGSSLGSVNPCIANPGLAGCTQPATPPVKVRPS